LNRAKDGCKGGVEGGRWLRGGGVLTICRRQRSLSREGSTPRGSVCGGKGGGNGSLGRGFSVRQHGQVRLRAIITQKRRGSEIKDITFPAFLGGAGSGHRGWFGERLRGAGDQCEGVGVEAIMFFLGADLQVVAVLVELEASVFLEAVLRSGEAGVDIGLEGGGVGGDDAVGIEGAFDFGLHFAAAREEALFKELLGI